jgi:transcription initiation factor IIE alpha subunit
LDYEANHDFYSCETVGCRRVTFEEAVEAVFHCSACGKPLAHSENGKMVEKLSEKVEILRKELGE